MIIKPHRTMFLDGKRVEKAVPVEVSDSQGELAIRHKWAEELKGKQAAKAAAEAEAAKAAAEAEAAKAAAEAEAAKAAAEAEAAKAAAEAEAAKANKGTQE